MTDESYNGWTNRETWLIRLWLDNDEYHYLAVGLMCSEIDDQIMYPDTTYTYTRDRVHIIAEAVSEYVSSLPEITAITDNATIAADLIGGALARVNWDEVARSYAEEYPYAGDPDEDDED